MKSYKKFGSKLIGYSDYASLLLAGPRNEEGLTSQFIHCIPSCWFRLHHPATG